MFLVAFRILFTAFVILACIAGGYIASKGFLVSFVVVVNKIIRFIFASHAMIKLTIRVERKE